MKQLAHILVILASCLASNDVQAQRGYSKDSLQIKVYSEIMYSNSEVTSLKVTKVFCDYCNENQLKLMREEALRRSYEERFTRENKLVNGKRKLALYIRISKKDFLNLKDEN